MLLWLRCHVPLAVAFESVSVAGMRRGGGASWREALAIARGMHESLTLIQKLGYRLYPSGKARLHSSPAWLVAGMLWSMSRIPSGMSVAVDRIRAMRPSDDLSVATGLSP